MNYSSKPSKKFFDSDTLLLTLIATCTLLFGLFGLGVLAVQGTGSMVGSGVIPAKENLDKFKSAGLNVKMHREPETINFPISAAQKQFVSSIEMGGAESAGIFILTMKMSFASADFIGQDPSKNVYGMAMAMMARAGAQRSKVVKTDKKLRKIDDLDGEEVSMDLIVDGEKVSLNTLYFHKGKDLWAVVVSHKNYIDSPNSREFKEEVFTNIEFAKNSVKDQDKWWKIWKQ